MGADSFMPNLLFELLLRPLLTRIAQRSVSMKSEPCTNSTFPKEGGGMGAKPVQSMEQSPRRWKPRGVARLIGARLARAGPIAAISERADSTQAAEILRWSQSIKTRLSSSGFSSVIKWPQSLNVTHSKLSM